MTAKTLVPGALSLVAGLGAALAIAWACTFVPVIDRYPWWNGWVKLPTDTPWPGPVPSDWPPPQSRVSNHGLFMSRHTYFGDGQLGAYWYTRNRHGLPFRALECRTIRDSRTKVSLPHRSIWSGFVLNTLFYCVVLRLLPGTVRSIRRYWRARRATPGACLNCSYPIGTSAVCTECGALLAGPGGAPASRLALRGPS